MQKKSIGIFDSGYGGLSIFKEIVKLLPDYDFNYLGDNARAPYGERDFDTVYKFTLDAVKWFFRKDCPLVILACNTASAKALRTIQQNDLHEVGGMKKVLGIIRPTAEVLGEYSKTGHAGILATPGTVLSGSYLLEAEKFFPELQLTQQACPEWVNLVESGMQDDPSANEPVKKYIEALLQKDPAIDAVLLACTHYPLLLKTIQKFVPPNISIISQGEIIAKSLGSYLHRHPETDARCGRNGKRSFFTTGDPADFDSHATVFFGGPVHAQQTSL